MKRRRFLSFVGIAVSGCALPNTRDPLYRSYVTEIPDKHGIVFGSLGYIGHSVYAPVRLLYRAKGFEMSRAFYIPGSLPQFHFAEGDTRGTLFFAQLAPTEYEIFNFELVHDMGPLGRNILRSKTEFSVPFSATEGRATYLGQILVVSEFGKNALGMRVPAGGYFVVSDQTERDVRLLQSQFKEVDISKVDRAVIDPARAGFPFFLRRLGEQA